MRINKVATALLLLAPLVAGSSDSHATLVAFLDFTTDIRTGAVLASNGTADWIDNLDLIATAAGISMFTAAERDMIEAGIKSQLETMYSAYSVTFATTLPGGSHERIYFGSFSATLGALGVAPLDFMNLTASTGTEDTAARVHTNNFGFFIEDVDPRATIIAELTAGIAGTAAHELGHAVGVNHHHSYGDPAISPANYSDTTGIQNTHIMATGATGISEVQRETPRTFSQWENLQLEAAGGAHAVHGSSGTSLAATVLAESDLFSGPDVGDTAAAATSLPLSFLPISGLEAANTVSSLSSDTDIDFFKFDVTGPSRILADVWSLNRYGDNFDTILTLFDTDGTTPLALIDDTTYLGNAYNNGTPQSLDSSLLNITLAAAGTYFLRVSAFGNLDGPAGGNYNLIFGVAAIPEARTWLTMGTVAIGALGISWFRRRSQAAASPDA